MMGATSFANRSGLQRAGHARTKSAAVERGYNIVLYGFIELDIGYMQIGESVCH